MSHRTGRCLVGFAVVILGLGLLREAVLAHGPRRAGIAGRHEATVVTTLPATLPPISTLAPEPTLPTDPTLPVPPTLPVEPTIPPTVMPRVMTLNMPLIWRQPRSLVNGDFEAGPPLAGWTLTGQLPVSVAANQGRSGYYAVLLGNPLFVNEGGCPVGESVISQSFEVPMTKAALSFWYRIYSYDTLDFDRFSVYIRPRSGGSERRVWFDGRIHWDEYIWDSGWRQAVIPLEDYGGQTVELRFVNAMTNDDGWYNTWTLVDDVCVRSNY